MKIRTLLIFIFTLSAAIILHGCGSTSRYKSDNRRQSMMLQKNTEMSKNKKYHSRENNSTKKRSHRRYSRS